MQSLLQALTDPSAFAAWVSGESQAGVHEQMQIACDRHQRLVLWAPPEFGKSRQITFRRLCWEIITNPDIRIGIVGAKDQQARDLLRGLKQTLKRAYVQGAPGVLLQDRDDRILVARTITEPEPTVQAIGIGGSFIGARLDLIVIDDAIKFADSWSGADRERKYKWIISSECMGRLLPKAQLWVLGNTWHPEDAMHRLVASHGFHAERVYAATDPVTLEGCTWPEVFPKERLEQKRKDLGGLEFARQYFHQAVNLENQRFKAEWFEAAFARGRTLSLEYEYKSLFQVFHGVDYGVGQKAHHDKTAEVTLEVNKAAERRLLWVDGGHYQSPEIRDRLLRVQDRYPGVSIRVEHAGQQAMLTPVLQEAGVHVVPHNTTAASKHDVAWGIEALAVKWESGLYVLPARSKDNEHIQALIRDCLYYTPQDHPGDYLMALWIADSGAASFSSGPAKTSPPKKVNIQL